ncbi:MAG: MFS transporter [Candidatus Nanopelagicales bacterium]
MNRLFHRAGSTPLLAGLPREVAVLAAIAFCVALGFGIVAPVIPIYAESFGVTAFLASAVISVFALMRFVSSPVAGRLVDRMGERRVLTTGLIIVAGSSVLAGLAQSYVQLIVLRGLGGVGSSMFTVSAMALLLKVVRAEQRGRAAGAFQAGFLLGGVAGPAVGGLVVAVSIRAPFFLYAVTLGAAALVSWRLLPAEPAGEPIPEQTQTQAPTDAAPPAPTLAEALRNRAYQAALAANLTNGFVTFGLRSSLVPLFVIEGLESDATLSGIGFLVAAATQAVLLLPAGRVADQRGRRPALIAGTTLTVVGMGALALTAAPPLFLVAMAISGLAAAFMGSAPAAVAGDVVGPGGRGIVIAVFQMVSDLGAILGPLIAGLLADSLGYGPAFEVGVAVALFALVMAALMPETLRRTAD